MREDSLSAVPGRGIGASITMAITPGKMPHGNTLRSAYVSAQGTSVVCLCLNRVHLASACWATSSCLSPAQYDNPGAAEPRRTQTIAWIAWRPQPYRAEELPVMSQTGHQCAESRLVLYKR